MRLPTVPSNTVVEHLNSTYFNQVWNAPDDHGRSNFQLHKAAKRLQTGAVPVGLSVVGLPTTDAVYAVYQTGYRGFNRFSNLPENRWVSDSEIFTTYGVSMVAYGTDGRVCPGGKIWLCYLPMRNQVLIAIDRVYTSQCIGKSYPDLYMTVYKDTTRATPIVSKLFITSTVNGMGIPPSTIVSEIASAKALYPHGTMVTVNGWVYDPAHVPTLQNGDVVGIVSDPDVVGYCDISVDDNATGYYSDLYEEYRELLHIPKSINPQNVILTNDTLSVVVFNTTNHKGVLGHRVDDNAVESVTHNDFSMGRSVIQAFSQALEATNVKVRLYVRYPTNPNVLGEDVNHLKDLYSLPDADIIKQLLGIASGQIPEWQAKKLEDSGFLSLLYRFDGFKESEVIQRYIDAMGYYDVASVLGQQMRFFTFQGAQVQIMKPARLFGYQCQAIVYINGRKVPEGKYEISDYKTNSFLLGFKASSGVKIGDRIGLYIFEAGFRTPLPYNPTAEAPALKLDSEDYSLVQIFSYSDDQNVWKGKTRKGLKALPYATADYTVTLDTDGKYRFEVREQYWGKNFYLIPKFGMITAVYSLTTPVLNKDPIIVDLKTTDINGSELPMMGFETMEVYLNGRRLIDGLDYECKAVEGQHDDTLQLLLTVSNYDYLDFSIATNLLEICVHGDKVASEDKGYALENKLHRTAVPMIWTRPSSRVFVRGVLQEKITESGNIAIPTVPVDNGAPFLMQYMLSFGAGKLLKNISPNLDINLRSRIERSLGIIPAEYPDVVIVEHLHALYSPFLAQIVWDVAHGLFTIVDEPKNDRFIKQFAPYAPLLERDPTVGPNNRLIDRRFVTLAAHYANFGVTDPVQMIRTQRLVDLVLSPSELSIAEVLL